jgi:hypothetical protein
MEHAALCPSEVAVRLPGLWTGHGLLGSTERVVGNLEIEISHHQELLIRLRFLSLKFFRLLPILFS